MVRLIGRAKKATVLAFIFFSGLAVASEPEAVPGEYIVKLKGHPLMAMSKMVLSEHLGAYVKSVIPSQNIVVIKRAIFESQSSVLKTILQNPDVDIVEPNYIYRINKIPNDPFFSQLWGLKNIGQKDSEQKLGTVGVDVGAEKAWDLTTGSKDVLLAVIDTGVDYNHPDLKDNIWINEAELNGQAGKDDDNNGVVDDIHGASFVDENKPAGNPLDDHGHGTHCAGTIGGVGNDGRGIVGVAWNVKIMGVKFLSATGSGSLEGALKSIEYATKMGARIMSNSWGGGGYSEALKQAIEQANSAGALFVAAAGNESNDNDANPSYPASYDVPNIISVAAIDNRGELASFSNYGKKSVHVGAPGVNIYSSIINGSYDSWSGTSMATPHVSGAAVLLASREPNLTSNEMKQRITSTSRPMPGLRGKSSGGLIDVYAMLTNTQAPPDPNDPAQWKAMSLKVSSAHPYKDNTKESFTVKVPGAKQISLYFSKFDTEREYDKVELFNSSGRKIGEMSGKNDDSYSPVIDGDVVQIVFTSDDSVSRYGFDITKAAWR
jgi:subtilisin family serine protease